MKTVYSKPMVEKIEFDYQTVIATSGGACNSNEWTKAAYQCTLTDSNHSRV